MCEAVLGSLSPNGSGDKGKLTHKKKLQMTKEDCRAFDRAKECNICKEDLIRHNERDETEFWDPETGAYCGKVHKYKQAPVKGNRTMSCYQYMMNISSTDKRHKRDYKTKKEILEVSRRASASR